MLRAEIFDRDKIAGSPRLRSSPGTGPGSDNVDLDAATEAGVWVTVTPGRNSRAVAEHVFALALVPRLGKVPDRGRPHQRTASGRRARPS